VTPTARLGRHATAISLVVLALLAYVPALASSPGRMPADTKLYLYLDPWGLFGRAASTFEPDQFAGWVPFQQITYLWPSGPWYLLFDTLGVPDWIAHRLWIGTIMFLAGAGVRWAARLLGVSALGALAAAVVYQLSPFLLAYISRTSLLLLPWAGLGWIVALTVRATLARVDADTEAPPWRRRLGAWRDPALIALIVATVGSTNATTLAMIVPAPVLWIVHVAWQRRISWRSAAAVTARIAVLCTAVSVWWIAMLSVQSRNGPAVLAYTETLADVSRNATGSEVLRGLGYWLFYQRDPVAATTTASGDYLVSVRVMALSYAVVLVGLVGLVVTSWAQRRFAALCVAAGVVLAVGVHPIDDPSPLFSLFVGDDESGLALALRSSTRAVPVFLLGVALGAGALVSIAPRGIGVQVGARLRAVPGVRVAATAAVVLLAIVNLPSLWQRAFVDPAIDRDQDPPAAWADAVDRLDSTDPNARVLQVGGAEFGAFRWGYATDHPLVGLTDKPVVTRDLLPLGSPAAMDLLFALDDRIQEGTLEAQSIAPIARLLGADIVWLSNDAAFERFRTARPETIDEALTESPVDGLGPAERFGEPVVNVAEVDMTDPASIVDPAVGTPRSPVALAPIVDPLTVIRAATETVVVSGSGDGLIDAAASGLLSGHELTRYSASLAGAELIAAIDDARALIVTDTNRDQAHHWRGSQDVRGHTESGGADTDVLVSTSADQRLDVFGADGDTDADQQTIAIQDGPVTAIASAYGEPFAYRPEDRAVMAIDGDPTTAWRVDDHGDPVGERILLTIDDAIDRSVDRLILHQAPTPRGGRSIATVRITVAGQPALEVELTPASFEPSGQLIEIPPARGGEAIDVEITAIAPGEVPLAASLAGVGFSEIDLGLGATTEYVRPPVDGLDAVDAQTPLALLFTRWRTDPSDPWRADPEPELRRRFPIPSERTVDTTVTLRLDRRATDADLAALLDPGSVVPIASSRVTGGVRQRGAATIDGDSTTAWVTGFDEAVGARLTFPELGVLGPALLVDQPSGPYSTITEVELRRSDAGNAVTLAVPAPDAAGRSAVALPAEIADVGGPLELTITAVEPRVTIDRRYGDPRTLPAAIAELTATDGIDAVPADPSRPVTATCSDALVTIDGVAVPLTFASTVGELLAGAAVEATSCEPTTLDAGTHDLDSTDMASPLSVDRVVLTDPLVPAPSAPSEIGVDVVRNDPRARDVVVDACPAGCWIVLGEGFNDAWSADANGTSLGPPALVDGGFNGWLLPPGDTPTTVEFRWTAQRPVTIGLAVSAIAALACLLVAVLGARRVLAPLPRPRIVAMRPTSRHRAAISGAVLVAASVLLIGPEWGLVAAFVAAVELWLRRSRTFEIAGIAAGCAVAVGAMWVVRNDRPFPNAGWTTSVEHLNGLALFAVIVLVVGAAFAGDADRDADREPV
jgi:arabinofuranan 3-O-arabinosyltransferase